MDDRLEILKSLLEFAKPIEEITESLSDHAWDSDEFLITLELEHIRNVLDRFLSRDLDKKQIETWANAIECRDDIGFDRKSSTVLRDLIHELANPLLTQKLTVDRAEEIIRCIGVE